MGSEMCIRDSALTAGLGLLLLGELSTGAVPWEPIDTGAAAAAPYRWLAAQPGDGPVMEFPAEDPEYGPTASSARRHAGLAMYWSTVHWKPLVNGISGFTPDGHKDLLAAFRGTLRRADGSAASNVSFVDAGNVALLQQLGVRYLVVHRDRYRDRDWPAVASLLAGLEDNLTQVGEFGAATIYLVEPPARVAPAPTLTVSVPALAVPGGAWQPIVTVTNGGPDPALFSLTRPLRLETTWYDDRGREVGRDTAWLEVPAVLQPGRRLDCLRRVCAAVRDHDALPTRPARATSRPEFRPTAPGRYTVRIELRGEVTVRCEGVVDVVGAVPRDRVEVWWSCSAGAAAPMLRTPPQRSGGWWPLRWGGWAAPERP